MGVLKRLFKNNCWFIYERSKAIYMKKAVAYYRVSTDKQGESGLGLEAQEEAVHLFIKSRQIKLIKEFIEVESTRKNKRPVLQKALNYCFENATLLIIAKLDRIGRNVAFISSLMESKVEFIAADYPTADRLILHILAAFAEYEREQISKRTRAALKVAKLRGVELGKQGKVLAEINKKAAIRFAKKLKPIITKLKMEGHTSVQAITDQLNKRKIPTYRIGAKWHKSTVHKVLGYLK